jgi:hypothetical protein
MHTIMSENIADLAVALAKAQGVIQNPIKDKANPHFKSTYADIASGLDVVRPAFSMHGLSVMQIPEVHEDQVIIRTQITHASGQWIAGFYPVSKIAQHQAMGAAMTYAKRQALFAMAGIAGDDDDDGNTASEPERAPPKPQDKAEPVADRMIAAIAKTDSAVALGEWWINPKVKGAYAGLGTSDKARVDSARVRRLADLQDEAPAAGEDPFAEAA